MDPLETFCRRTRIAYFSMEIALRPDIPTYSGGLGVLAGDTARSCSDLELPVVFVTLASLAGYLRRRIENGRICCSAISAGSARSPASSRFRWSWRARRIRRTGSARS